MQTQHSKLSIQNVDKSNFQKITCTPCMKNKGLKQCEGCGQILYNTSPPCELFYDCPQLNILKQQKVD